MRLQALIAAVVLGATPAHDDAPGWNKSAPLPFGRKAVSTHAPYAVRDCIACHVRADRLNPGPLREEGDALCYSCHEDLTKHAHAFRKCSVCHNSHESLQPHLLIVQADACPLCHEGQLR